MRSFQCSDCAVSPPLNNTNSRPAGGVRFIKVLSVILFLSGILISTIISAIEVTVAPSLTIDPNGVTPLAGVVELSTDVPARVTLTISDGSDSWVRQFAEFRTVHYLPVLGLKPDSSYTIEVIVTDEANERLDLEPSLQAATGPLPVYFPNMTVFVSEPARMEPGFTLLGKFDRGRGTVPDRTLPNYTIIVDESGDVVWYSPLGAGLTRQLRNGNLFYRSRSKAIEIDMLGNVVRTITLGSRDLHHDLFPTINGTFLSLTRETVIVDGYPSSETDLSAPVQTAGIEDNPVVEFRSDGSLINGWKLTDIVEPTRIGYDSVDLRPAGDFDWAHANAVVHDPNDDSIIVSIRHQDAVAKFSRSTGDLKWILGNHDNWSPEFQPFLLTPAGTPFEWQYHQHAQMITPSGTLLLFDNGNYRASPFDGRTPIPDNENYSRAVEYAIDEDAMEVRQIWEYGAQMDQRYYSGSRGDADWMENTGNVLITSSATSFLGGVSSDSLGMGQLHTRIIEVDHNTPAEKVFEIAVFNTTPGSQIVVYRSDRIPDLYPLDTDLDGVPDYKDNCVLKANGPLILDSGGNTQLDTDSDGFGNLCDPDFDNNQVVNAADLAYIKTRFFAADPDADLDGSGVVNAADLAILKSMFFQVPGPSALTPQ